MRFDDAAEVGPWVTAGMPPVRYFGLRATGALACFPGASQIAVWEASHLK
jgi:hypothetical protein